MSRTPAGALVSACLVLCVPLVLSGCGGGNEPMTEDEFRDTNLLEVGELLRMYQIETGEAPKSLQDIQAMPSLEMVAPMGYESVRKGDFVVRWNATLPDTGEEPGTTPDEQVLAYTKETPEQGGSVLLLNRTLVTMTPEEFAAAPKAGDEPPSD